MKNYITQDSAKKSLPITELQEANHTKRTPARSHEALQIKPVSLYSYGVIWCDFLFSFSLVYVYVAVCACMRSAELQSSKSPTKGFILIWVGQSEQSVLVGRRDFVENDTFERVGAWRTYNNVQYLKNNVFFEH